MLTMLPERLATITSPHSLDRCQMAVTFTSIARRNVSRSSSSTETVWPMPALLTSTSTVPHRRTVSATSRSRCVGVGDIGRHDDAPGEVGGQRRQPVGPASRDHDRGADGVEHPGEAFARPDEAPVTMATRPSRRKRASGSSGSAMAGEDKRRAEREPNDLRRRVTDASRESNGPGTIAARLQLPAACIKPATSSVQCSVMVNGGHMDEATLDRNWRLALRVARGLRRPRRGAGRRAARLRRGQLGLLVALAAVTALLIGSRLPAASPRPSLRRCASCRRLSVLMARHGLTASAELARWSCAHRR